MKQSTIRWVFILGALGIIAILLFQAYWLMTNWHDNVKSTEEKIHVVLQETALGLTKINKSTLPKEDLINRRSSNYYIVNINDHIDANILEDLLLQEMNRLGLKLDFEYAIYDCYEDHMQYGNYCDIDKIPDKNETSRLPKYEKFEYYFGVRFPQMRSSILGEMHMTLILSFILILTLAFFSFTMYVIVSQKRYTELQKDFINNMTHEFKTPLSSISIGAQTFLNSPKIQQDERLQNYAKIIKEQAARLNSHVEKILDLARLEQDKIQLKKETFSLTETTSQLCVEYDELFESVNGKIAFTNKLKKPAFILADKVHTTNVISNLIDNAYKYGGTPPIVSVDLYEEDKHFCIAVKDQGPGIAKKDQSLVFEKFFRITSDDVHDQKGFGLGLYYVNQMVTRHGWKIKLLSEEGKGATFIIKIEKQTHDS